MALLLNTANGQKQSALVKQQLQWANLQLVRLAGVQVCMHAHPNFSILRE